MGQFARSTDANASKWRNKKRARKFTKHRRFFQSQPFFVAPCISFIAHLPLFLFTLLLLVVICALLCDFSSMKSKRLVVYLVACLVALLVIALDQWTKQLASNHLASTRLGGFVHSIERVVEPDADGKTLLQWCTDQFSSKNTPAEIEQIAHSVTKRSSEGSDAGVTVAPTDVLQKGDYLIIGWREITVIPDYWDYQYTRNNGAAFSFLADSDSPLRTPFFVLVSLISIGVIALLLRGVTLQQRLLLMGLALVAGGAVGNLIDRILYGYVIDFIVWKATDAYRWPTFNIADSAIVVGVALLTINMIRDSLQARKSSSSLSDSEEVSAHSEPSESL